MANPKWGVKRICRSCAAKFYDLGRSRITCPKCGARFDPEALLKSRRNRPAAAPKPATAATIPVAPPESGPEQVVSAKAIDVDPDKDAAVPRDLSGDVEADDSVRDDDSEIGEGDDLSSVVAAGMDEND